MNEKRQMTIFDYGVPCIEEYIDYNYEDIDYNDEESLVQHTNRIDTK